MKLTKYGHACIVLEEQGKRLVIDPGVFTPDFGGTANIVAVVVTHTHQDHFNVDHLNAIVAANPDVKIFTTAEAAKEFPKPNVAVAKPDNTREVGGFTLRFGGERHALIHKDWPCPENTTVQVNDRFYYPGDSYTMPDGPVEYLAVAANAPWMKIADSVDYIAAVKPQHVIPTHDGLLSDDGKNIYCGGLGLACDSVKAQLHKLAVGESLEL